MEFDVILNLAIYKYDEESLKRQLKFLLQFVKEIPENLRRCSDLNPAAYRYYPGKWKILHFLLHRKSYTTVDIYKMNKITFVINPQVVASVFSRRNL